MTAATPPIVPYPPLLKPLVHALKLDGAFAKLWADASAWSGWLVRCEPAVVHCLEARGGHFMLLHVGPTKDDRRLWWQPSRPMAVQILGGKAELRCGFEDRHGIHTASRVVLGPGQRYEVCDPKGLHYLRPIGDEPLRAVAVRGKPWRAADAYVRELTEDEYTELRISFGWDLTGQKVIR